MIFVNAWTIVTAAALLFFCPQCAVAEARHKLDGSSKCLNFLCLSPCAARYIVREAYNIKGSGCCQDVMCMVCCFPCATCQMLNEVDTREAPPMPRVRSRPYSRFHSSLFQTDSCDCSSCQCDCDWSLCPKSFFCPSCVMADALQTFNSTEWWFAYCCISIPVARNLVRTNYGITENDSCGKDIFCGAFCSPLVVWQLSSEISRRGKVIKMLHIKGAAKINSDTQNPITTQPQ